MAKGMPGKEENIRLFCVNVCVCAMQPLTVFTCTFYMRVY